MAQHIIKSKGLMFAAVAIPVSLIIFITLLHAQQQSIMELKEDNAALRQENDALRSQGDFYKKAYQATLDDIMQLSAIYGGQQRYAERAEKLREQELTLVLANTTAENRTIENPLLWQEYVSSGIIHKECLRQTRISTATDMALVSVVASAPVQSDIQVYVDGNFLVDVPVTGVTRHRSSIVLPDGEHELSLVSRNGSVTIQQVTFDTEQVPANATIVDEGKGWSVFDCTDTNAGPTIDNPGALRILIYKE